MDCIGMKAHIHLHDGETFIIDPVKNIYEGADGVVGVEAEDGQIYVTHIRNILFIKEAPKNES